MSDPTAPSKQTQFPQTLIPDPPLVQDAVYRFDPADRQYIDNQIRGVQSVIAGIPGVAAIGLAAQLWVMNAAGTAPAWVTMSGDATITASGAVLNVGLRGVPVPAPSGVNTVLTYAAGALSWAPGGGGGSGITQLTQDVLAGPGSGSVPATVVGIHATSVPALTTGYLHFDGAALVWDTPAGGGITALTGDVTASGTGSVAATVAAINGSTVPAGGALTTGQVLRVTGASALGYGALDLANTSAVTGVLPITNLATGTSGYVLTMTGSTVTWAAAPTSGITALTGDVTASGTGSVAATVVKVNGASVSAAGALTTGNGLYVSGVSALTYGALNLAGGANYVTGALPITNLATGTNGFILTMAAGVVTWAANTAGGVTWANDLSSSSTTHQYVSGISGASGTAGTVTLGDGTNNLILRSRASLQATPPTLQFEGSAGFAAANVSGAGGTINIFAGVPVVATSGTAVGGQGGGVAVVARVGAPGLGGNSAGGLGGGIFFQTGSGGAGVGSAANSSGGNFTISLGAAGTGGSGAAGTAGRIVITGAPDWSFAGVVIYDSTGIKSVAGTTGQVLRATAGVPAWGALDLANTSAVTGVLPVTNLAIGSTGQVLTMSGSTVTWAAVPASGINQLTGDVTAGPGTGSQAATVVRINGATVSAAGALTTGNGLYVSGISALSYGALNLAGGVNYVTGTLPVGNLPFGTAGQLLVTNAGGTASAFVSMSGDATLTSLGAVTNTKVNGASVPAAGALTVGNVLRVNGASALSYSAVNLSGGSNWVTGALPVNNIAVGTAGQLLVTNSGATAPAWVSLSGDGTMVSTGALTITKINGASVPAAGGALTTGNGLYVSGVSALSYAALNLAGGTNFVTGILPVANMPFGTSAQLLITNAGGTASAFVTMSGDATILGAGTITVAKVNGTTVPAGGALTTGTVLRVTGVSAAAWGAVDLANTSAVTGLLPVTNLATGTNGFLLTMVSGVVTWAANATPTVTWADDLSSSSSTHQYVSGISGASGTAGTVTLGDGTNNLILRSRASLQATPPTLLLRSSAGFAAANVSGAGGACSITAGSGTVASSGTAVGGVGGQLNLSGGTGAAGLGGVSAGGVGGAVLISGGAGGNGLVSSTNAHGGTITLVGGPTGTGGSFTGLRGGVRLAVGATSDIMIETGEVNGSNRFVALCQGGSGITTTEMPVNAGDGVIWIGNALSGPSVAPVGGAILYATGGALWIKESGGNNFPVVAVSGITALTGDVTASGIGSVSATVVNINGASVPAAGALTTGNGLYVTATNALSYSALNLTGGVDYVTGNLPLANVELGASTNQLPFAAPGSFVPTWTAITGDITPDTATAGLLHISAISGANVAAADIIAIIPTRFTWDANSIGTTTLPYLTGPVGIEIKQTGTAVGGPAAATVIQAQGNASGGTGDNGGDLWLMSGVASGGTGRDGQVRIGGYFPTGRTAAISLNGSINHTVKTISSGGNYTCDSSQADYIIWLTGAGSTITLPSISGIISGGRTIVIISQVASPNCTLVSQGGAVIDDVGGATTSVKLPNKAYGSWTVVYDDQNACWFVDQDRLSTNAQTTNYTATNNDVEIDFALSAAAQLDLPACTPGKVLYVADKSNNFNTWNLTIQPNGTNQIQMGGSGTALVVTTNGWSHVLVGDSSGTNWLIF